MQLVGLANPGYLRNPVAPPTWATLVTGVTLEPLCNGWFGRTPNGDRRAKVVEAQLKALDMARESLSIAEVSYENGLITSIELSDARQALLETEWNLAQAKFAQTLAAAKTRYAGLS